MGTLFAWSLMARRLTRWSITAPVALTAAGVALTAGPHRVVGIPLGPPTAEQTVEVVLAVLLFTDAAHLPAGVLRGQRRLLVRLLLIALPLTLALAVLTGGLLFPAERW